jgi:site-specific recombinase XerD
VAGHDPSRPAHRGIPPAALAHRAACHNTCDSYAHAFRLLFEYASACIKLPPSQLQLEQLDAPLIVNFLNHLETSRGNGAGSRNIRRAAIKSFMHYLEYR